MSPLRIHILGTGTSQGIPVIGCKCEVCTSTDPRDKRLRCSVLLEQGDSTVLIDVGPDFRQQMLRTGRDRIDAVLITHEHNDHINGLDDVRPINFRWRRHLPLYMDARVEELVKQRFAYIFDTNYQYPGKPRIELRRLENKAFEVGDFHIIPIRIRHGGLPIWGFRVGNFAYITDAKTIPEEEFEKLEGLEVLVLNALHHRIHSAHLNLEEALDYVKRINPGGAYLTHLSHDMGLHKDVEGTLPPNIRLAFDGQVILVEG